MQSCDLDVPRPLTLEEIAARREAVKQRLLTQPVEQTTSSPDEREGVCSLHSRISCSTARTFATVGEADQSTGNQAREEEDEEEDKIIFLAFSRIYSGTLCRGQKVFVLHPRYDPHELTLADPSLSSKEEEPAHVSEATVAQLYLLMGREVVEVEEVPAGNVLGIGGLETHVLKSATVASTLACPAFRAMNFAAAPILHVAIEPVSAGDIPALTRGMRLLSQADACVEVSIQPTGEHILSTAGEVHLQRCLDDLRNTFAKIELNVSAPIVPFCETIIPTPKVDMLNEVISSENVVKLQTNPLLRDVEEGVAADNTVSIQTANKLCTLQIQAKPLPPAVTELLSSSGHLLKALNLLNSAGKDKVHLNEEAMASLKKLRVSLSEAFASDPEWSDWSQPVESVWACGPKATGTNILLNGLPGYKRPSIWRALDSVAEDEGEEKLREYDNSIISGFQLATLAGPLCEEPMRGVCMVLRGWGYGEGEGPGGGGNGDSRNGGRTESPDSNQLREKGNQTPVGSPDMATSHRTAQVADVYGPFSGQLISAVKEGCRRAFLSQPARLMAAMYTCDILATADVLGKLYAVLGRRNGRVYAEEMREGTAVFSIKALVPVAESFGFAEEVRKKTSGLASPQLVFSHWEVRAVASGSVVF